MPEQALGLFVNSPAFGLMGSRNNFENKIVGKYPDADVMQSGWLIGEEKLFGKASLLDLKYGEGRVILIGFGSQWRGQLHGTFRLFFNSIYYGAAVSK